MAVVPLPAGEIEQAGLQEIHATLQQPEMIIAVWRAAQSCQSTQNDTTLDEAQAVVAMRQMGQVWEQLFPVEQQRIAQLLIEWVQLHEEGLDIVWRKDGWQSLVLEVSQHPLVKQTRQAECEEGATL